MATHASRNTTTGLTFEELISMEKSNGGINVTKHNLYTYLEKQKVDWKTIISKKLLPDEAYIDPIAKTFHIYEKKYQETAGSCDEKPQTCAFKIWEYRRLAAALNIPAENVTYTYILSKWFNDPRYRDMLEYIRSVDGCDYILTEVA